MPDEDDECMHGLDPATCAICRARAQPKAPPRPPAPARAPRGGSAVRSRPAPAGAAAAGRASRRPGHSHLAGRAEYFGSSPAGVWWVEGVSPVLLGRRDGPGPWPAHQRNVGEVRDGDLTLHLEGGEVVAAGLAVGNGRAVAGPPPGWVADVEPAPLEAPLPVAELPPDLRPGPPYPFNRVGILQPGTCFPFPYDVAVRLARRYAGLWPPGSPWERLAGA